MAVEAEKAELPTSTLGGADSGGGGAAPGVLDSPRKPDAPPGPPVPPPAAAPEKKQQMRSPATTATANHQMANKEVGNDSSSNSKTSEMLGPIEMLQNPRLRLYIATALGGIPFLISGLLFVSSLSMVLQFIVGAIFGLLLMFSYQLIVLYRTHLRKVKAVQVAQMSRLDVNSLKELLPTEESFPRWIEFCEFEKMEWLNKLLRKMWPVLDEAAGKLIKEQVQPILDQYPMGVIERIILKKVQFGKRAPEILGIKVSPGGEDECILEMDVLWETEKEGVVIGVECPGPNFKVQVKNWHVHGTARVVFKPLTGSIPGFGAILVSLNEPPELGFDLKFLGGDIAALPGVEKMIDNSIRTALVDSMVWPSRIVVPMMAGDFSFLQMHAVGELDIKLIEGKNLKKTDLVGKTDPFVVMYVRQTKDKMKRSTRKKNALNPVWNENLKVEVEDPETQKLTLRLMDEDTLEKAEYVGSCEVSLAQFKPNEPKDMWLDVLKDPKVDVEGNERGQLHVIIVYNQYSMEQIARDGGVTSTQKKLYEEQTQIKGAAEKHNPDSSADAPKQQGNITQDPDEKPRLPGPAAELP
ncbi:unnamed protein product [Sphagnum compactum]